MLAPTWYTNANIIMKNSFTYLSQTYVIFAIVAIFFGLIFVKITPPLWGADEGQHFFRAYQLSKGEFVQPQVTFEGKTLSGGRVPGSFRLLDKLREKDITDAIPGESKQVDGRDLYDQAAHISVTKDTLTANPYGKNIYSPLVYGAPALGVAIGRAFSDMPLSLLASARIATLFLYVSLVSFALFLLRRTFVRWLVFVIALLPMSIYQASVVSPDSLLLGLSLIFFAAVYSVIHVGRKLDKKTIGLLALSAGLLTLVKMPYVILVLLLTILPLPKHLGKRQRMILKVAVPMIALLVALFSLMSIRGVAGTPLTNISISVPGQLHWVLGHPLSYIYVLMNSVSVLDWVPQAIGLFGSSFIFIPGFIFQILLIGISLMAFMNTKQDIDDSRKSNTRTAVVYLLICLLLVIGIASTLYLTWTPVGANLIQGVQGRYFLPIVVFVLMGMRMLTRARLMVSQRSIMIGSTLLSSTTLLVSILWYYRILY